MREFHRIVGVSFRTHVETLGGTRSCILFHEDWTGRNLEGEQFTHHVCRYHDLERERDFVVVWGASLYPGIDALVRENLTNPQT